MFSKLQEVVQKFEALNRQLEDPAVYADREKLKAINRERKGLSEVVEAYKRYKRLDEDIQGNQELLRGNDPELAVMAQEELPGLVAQKEELEEQIKILMLPKDPLDDKNTLLEIRAGTGGDEAALFAADLYRMYQRYGERLGFQFELMNQSLAASGGFKEVVALVSGEMVYSHLKYEAGVHRVQRVPTTEAQGRIHTSTVTVAVMPEADEVDVSLEDKDLEVSVCRAGGPGGQGVNTTDSAVRIVHIPSGLTVQCQDERSQIKNRAKAKKILLARLYEQKRSELEANRSAQRKGMVGSGERAEKIRTYNFPQNRISDHRVGLTLHKLDRVIEGDMQELLDAVNAYFQAEQLKGES